MTSKRKKTVKKPLRRRIRRFMRRHFFNKRAAQGSVTIFLIIIMLPMMIFSCSVIDICKIFMARNSTEGALELAMNSRLASYDDVLKDMYGILASSANEEELADKLTTYYKMTLESSTGTTLDKDGEKYVENFFSELFHSDMSELDSAVQDTNGLLNLFEDSDAQFSVTPIATSSVTNPDVMHKQIVEYMKYRGPVYLTTGVLDKIMAFSDVSNQANAAKAQIEFEKSAEKLGKTFNGVYETLEEFLRKSEELQTSQPFSGFYENGLVPPKELRDNIQKSLASAYICSFFGGAFSNSGTLEYVGEYNNMLEIDKGGNNPNPNAEKDLTNCLNALKNITSDAEKAQEIFGNSNIDGMAFINSKDAAEAADLLDSQFGILFKNHPKVKNENVETNVLKLLEAYTEVSEHLIYVKDRLTKDNLTEHEVESLKGEETRLEDLICEAGKVLTPIRLAAEAIKSFMEKQYDKANTSFTYASASLNSTLTTMNEQIKRLDDVVKGINNIKGDLDDSLKKSDTFGKSITGGTDSSNNSYNGINSESERAGMMQTHDSCAKLIEEIALNDDAKNELVGYLEKLRSVYQAEVNALQSIEYLGKKMCSGNSVDANFRNYLNNFYNGQKAASVGTWYDFSTFKVGRFFSYAPQSGENIGAWDKYNDEIRDNTYYEALKKYGEERKVDEEAKKQAENAKNSIDKMGEDAKPDGESLAGETVPNTEVPEPDVDEVHWFIPNAYPTYESYVSALKSAYSTRTEGDDILNELNDDSFSYEISGKKTDIPSADNFNGDAATGAINALEAVGNFFSNLLKASRDNLYIAEYLTENFPCFTTLQGSEKQKEGQMISGEKFYDGTTAKVVCAHSSLEYILYGDINSNNKGEAAASVAKASAVLFGVRFALNLIYALTSSELAMFIDPIVAPLNAIPFVGLLARTVILIGLALAESAIDVGLLLADQEVALFKTSGTWICSPTGLVTNGAEALLNTVVDKAGEAVSTGLCMVEQDLANELKKGTNDVTTQVNSYVDEMVKELGAEIENDVWNPIVSTIRYVIDDYDINGSIEESKIAEKLETSINIAVENLGLNDPSTDQDIVKSIEKEIFEYIIREKDSIARTISDNLPGLLDSAKKGILEGVETLDAKVKSCLSGVENKITSYVKDKTSKLNKKVNEAVDLTVKDVQKGTIKITDSLTSDIKASINEDIRGVKSASPKVDLDGNVTNSSKVNLGKNDGLITEKDSKTKKKADTTIKVKYEDYMYVFTVIGLCFNENDMLMRASQLMNANIELRIDGEVRTERPKNAYNSDVTYDLNKAYTLFKGEAGSKTRTMFFGTTWNKENQQWILPASNVYSYKATTYVGY